jgi:glutaminyl-peptide cyclotransferase
MRRLLIVAAVALAACGSSSPSPAKPLASATAVAAKVDRFDANAAWDLTQLQVDAGQRPAGSPQLRKIAAKLKARMPHARYENIPGQPGLRNVVARLPGKRPGIVVGAHYDTLVKPEGFVGANNGASGSAIVVQIARALNKLKRPKGAREVTFVLFDGEEPPSGLPEDDPNFSTSGLRGSRAYVKKHPGRTSQMILLDYVAGKGLQLPREGTSNEDLWNQLRAASRAVGKQKYFPDDVGTSIIDDHTPFLQSGVPAVDLIDWSYPGHSLEDGMNLLSKASMDAVGESVLELVRRLQGR